MRWNAVQIVGAAAVWIISFCPPASAATIDAGNGLSVHVDPVGGDYQVMAKEIGWTFGGSLKTPLTDLTVSPMRDGIGGGQEVSFAFIDAEKKPLRASIRVYSGKPVVLFTEMFPKGATRSTTSFPAFTILPGNLHAFSHGDSDFSPPQFKLSERGMQWMMFDDHANTWVMSPASHFLASRMLGDGKSLAGSGLNAGVRDIPEGFQQQTLFAVGKGIGRTMDVWGEALTRLHGKRRPPNDADRGLKYLGYWTDNGAAYYYHYDADKGYAGTMLAVADYYRQKHIPLGYLQLDSWWYYKSLDNPEGGTEGPKVPSLPAGEWNRYGGLLNYTAHKDLFPDGLAAFQKRLGLPLITHNRWIDRKSPYHEKYDISGVAAVDPRWWDDIANYVKSSGVITYEQDWLNRIYSNSPGLGATVDLGDRFLDNMARACEERGISMQYCMPLPCEFLQGCSEYDNLTSIRVNGDRFQRKSWRQFLFNSQLASVLGVWPWTDVFNSTERENLLLADLSAGMVGVGDAIGKESRANIMQAVRGDGVIVKPDVPLTPTDECYINSAQGHGDLLIGVTHCDHAAGRTAYVFAFSDRKAVGTPVVFSPFDLGVRGAACVWNPFTKVDTQVAEGATFTGATGADGSSYYIVCPISSGGISLLGDQGKFVSMGKQRIAEVTDDAGRLTAEVVLVAGDSPVILHGFASKAPRISSPNGLISPVLFDPTTKHFSAAVSAKDDAGDSSVSVVIENR